MTSRLLRSDDGAVDLAALPQGFWTRDAPWYDRPFGDPAFAAGATAWLAERIAWLDTAPAT